LPRGVSAPREGSSRYYFGLLLHGGVLLLLPGLVPPPLAGGVLGSLTNNRSNTGMVRVTKIRATAPKIGWYHESVENGPPSANTQVTYARHEVSQWKILFEVRPGGLVFKKQT
jgi:hypothetical protein